MRNGKFFSVTILMVTQLLHFWLIETQYLFFKIFQNVELFSHMDAANYDEAVRKT